MKNNWTNDDPLAVAFAYTTYAAAGAIPSEQWPWWFARCWLLLECARYGMVEALGAARDDLARVPAGAPGRARLAAALVEGRQVAGPRAAAPISAAAGRAARMGDDWPWTFTRCWLLAGPFNPPAHDRRDLEAAMAAFATLPDGTPGRTRLAALLVQAHLRRDQLGTPEAIDPVHALAAIADHDPSPIPEWREARAVVRAEYLRVFVHFGRAGITPETALAEIDELAALVGDRQPYAQLIQRARLFAELRHGADDRDLAALDGLVGGWRALYADTDPTSPTGTIREIVEAWQEVMTTAGRDDIAGTAAVVDRVEVLRKQLPPDHPFCQGVDQWIAQTRAMTRPAGPAVADLNVLRAAAEQPGLHPTVRAEVLIQLGAVEAGIGGPHLDDAVTHVRTALDTTESDDRRRILALRLLGYALLQRFMERSDRRDLAEALTVLTECRDRAEGPHHPDWSITGHLLATAQGASGRLAESKLTALDALRGHAATVLLQPRTANAATVARTAATEAVVVARMFLDDGDAAGAAQALDTGRGLVLRAAAQFGDVDEQLRARGAHELAMRWAEVIATGPPEQAPAGLRRAIVVSLSTPAPGATATALDPPEHAETQTALKSLGLDALVHLMPGNDGEPGAAVIVPVDDQPWWLPLPLLEVADPVLTNWLSQATGQGLRDLGRDIDPEGATTAAGWRDSLDGLCHWAWKSAIGPLLAELGKDGRTARLALVPMGPLARVPWHAAHDGHRYAVERATFTYAVSARSLCDGAWASDVALEAGLVIGDPDTGPSSHALPAARAEALAVHEAFYPAGRYVGRAQDGTAAVQGPGSRDDLAGWLAGGAGTVLHAACHGNVDTATAGASYLLLSGGSRLTAAELVQATATRRGRSLALAVLGACSTGVPGKEYDEAFSLGTAFLTAGTRTVVSAMWKVPDDATSVLMFILHHFLRTLPPLDALTASQRWMLDPDRRVPDEMPPTLRRHLASGNPADAAAWAGFVHAGR